MTEPRKPKGPLMSRSRRLTLETLCDRRVLENHAPVLDTSSHPELTPVIIDGHFNPAGTLVSDFADPQISDSDPGATKGIAIVGLTERGPRQGKWEYSIDGGGTWHGLANGAPDDPLDGNAPSDTAAVLLTASDRVRYLPTNAYFGTPQLKFRAWDQTDEANHGSIVDTTGKQGGAQAYSIASLSAHQPIYGDVPVVLLSGTVNYKLGDPPAVLAPNAKVFHGGGGSFAGGELDVDVTQNGQHNRLGIAAPFVIEGMDVKLNDTVIGQWTNTGIGFAPLTVTFNANATQPIVQQLVRSITYQNLEGSLGKRVAVFRLADSEGVPSASQSKGIRVTSDGALTPVINMSGTVSYQRNDPAVTIAPNATVTNVDTNHFAGGTLTIAVGPNGENNILAIGGVFTVSSEVVNNSNPIYLDDFIIGYRVSNGVGKNVLKITLNANVTKPVLEDLIRAINYQNNNGTAGTRTITFTLNYNDRTSIGSKQVNVT
jgi:hypothetical protein